MDFSLEKLANLASQYDSLIGLIVLVIGGLFTIPKIIGNFSKKVEITIGSEESVITPNLSLNKLTVINNKSEKLIIKKIDLILYDKNNEYQLNLNSDTISIDAESIHKIELEPVSYYDLDGEYIDIKNLMLLEKKFYFVIHCPNKKLTLKNRLLFKLRKQKVLKPIRFEYKGIIHSADWEYGFTCNKDNIEETGFLNNKRLIIPFSRLDIDARGNDIFNTDFAMAILTAQGYDNIQFKKLKSYSAQIKIKVLGDNIPKNNRTVHFLSNKDILNFKVIEE